jgi:hypothetical protein
MREILRWHGPGEVSRTVRLKIVHTDVHSNGANLNRLTGWLVIVVAAALVVQIISLLHH